jgi:hypothetical protein
MRIVSDWDVGREGLDTGMWTSDRTNYSGAVLVEESGRGRKEGMWITSNEQKKNINVTPYYSKF